MVIGGRYTGVPGIARDREWRIKTMAGDMPLPLSPADNRLPDGVLKAR